MANDPLEVDISGLGSGQMRALEHEGVSILLCNVDGEIYAVENECSHAAVPLDEGTLRGCELECDFHGAVFDVRSGEALAMPATRSLRTFSLEREGQIVRLCL
jgi:3-phenylpropionate/trans-cinnamate dioxygenase ferredoxin subunit